MKNVIVVADPGDDHNQFLNLGYPILRCDAEGRVSDLQSTSEISLPDLQLNALCVLASSKDGLISAQMLSSRFAAELGATPPPLVDLTDAQAGQLQVDALSRIVDTLLQDRFNAARRQVELSRDLSHLRTEYEELSRSFSLLETYVRESDLDHRQLTRDLAPAVNTRPVTVLSESRLCQRLPGSSSGLCDVAVHIAKEPAGSDGQLHVQLYSMEKDNALFEWSITGAELTSGWLRLPMGVALGPDNTTLQLMIDWSGKEPLELDWSLRHPDPRYCIQSDDQNSSEEEDRVLALRLWRYIPGCAAPLPSDGINTENDGVHELTADALQTGRNLNPGNSDTKYLDQFNAFQVHPVQGDTAAALLYESVSPGTRKLHAKIKSLSDKASDIEFSLALAPVSARLVPQSSRGMFRKKQRTLQSALGTMLNSQGSLQSEWYRLSAGEHGSISLVLPEPATEAMDLYLMTRMASSDATPSWAWATFSTITLSRSWD